MISRLSSRILFLFIFTAFSSNGAKSQTIRIMPLGNSITAGSMCTTGDIDSCVALGGHKAVGYRQRLASRLSTAGYDFDFVGSETYGNALMADSDCAGFGGIRDSQLADIMETGSSSHTGYVTSGPYLNSYPADIVLLHIGTNDVLAADTAWADVDRILDAIDDYESSQGKEVMVFLARIISTRGAPCRTNPRVIAYNRIIDNLASSRIAAGDQLILIDMECGAGLDYYNDLADQVHPNQSGYDKMGEAWFAAIDAWSPTPNPTYSLTMEPSIGNGTTSPSEGTHNYVQGSTVSVSATGSPGYVFSQWSGDLSGNANPESVILNGNKSIRATFEQRSYDLTMTTDGTAGVVLDPAGSFPVGHGVQTAISVTSLPEGSSFDGWEVISGSSVTIANPSSQSTSVKLESGNATVRANFTSLTHTVIIDISGEGSVSKAPDLEEYPANSVVTLTAIPASGYHFVRWTGDASGTTNPTDLLMDGEKGLRATFQKSTYTLTVNSDGTAGVVVDPSNPVTVDHGDETAISVSSVPDGSTFYGWVIIAGSSVTIADSSSLSTTVRLESGNATIQANFTPFSHALTISVTGEGSVDQAPDQADYPHNSVLTLRATAGTAYDFTLWSGDLGGNSNPVELTMDSDKSITANFEKRSYQLTVYTDGTRGAVVDPMGSFSVDHGDETSISVSQVPANQYFEGWEIIAGSSVTIADPSSLSTTVRLESGNAGIQANFLDTTVLGTTGQLDEAISLDIFPNPARDYIILKRGNNYQGPGRILVIDMKGRFLSSQYIPAGYHDLQVNIADLKPGIYMVHLIMESGQLAIGKLIKPE